MKPRLAHRRTNSCDGFRVRGWTTVCQRFSVGCVLVAVADDKGDGSKKSDEVCACAKIGLC
jgi:hypothetical protein